MSFDQITELRFAADIAMTMLIWMVQIIIYPAFRVIVPHRFPDWHHQYMKTISRIVLPLMLLQAVCHGLITALEPTLMQSIANAALAGAWIVTFTLSVPCHRALKQSGYQIGTINRLIRTNWLRTLLWSLVLLTGAASIRTECSAVGGSLPTHRPAIGKIS